MTFKRIIPAVCVLVVVFSLIGFNKLETAMMVGAGSKAKFLCSNVFISSRTPESVLENEACNATRNIGFLGFLGDALTMCDVNPNDKSAACRLLWVKRKTVYQEQYGATLLYGTTNAQIKNSEETIKHREFPSFAPVSSTQESMPCPSGDLVNTDAVSDDCLNKLSRLLDKAFVETDGKNPKRTHGIVIVYNGQLIAEQYATDMGYTMNTPHYGWSMTKSVTAVMIGILVKQGKLDINAPAPILQWRDLNDPNDIRHSITTDHLLRMSSGLKFNEDYNNPVSDVNQMLFGNHRDMVEFATDKPLQFQIDTYWQYSTATSTLLGAVIKNTLDSEKDYQAFARKELFNKLGMHTAIIESDQSGNLGTGAYMWASPRDWARFGLFCLQNGLWQGEQILPDNWMTYATTPTSTDPMAHYGAQFWLNSKKTYYPSLPADLYECRGKDIQRVTIIPSQKLVVARFGYTPNDDGWDHEGFVLEVLQAINNYEKID